MRLGTASACLATIAVIASGCAGRTSPPSLTPEALQAVRSEGPLRIVRAKGSGLFVLSPSSTVLNALPVIGIASAVSDAHRAATWIRDYGLEDPARSVQRLLAAGMVARSRSTEARSVDLVLRGSTADELRRALGEGHALVLRTYGWKLGKGTGWAPEIALSYQVDARLVRVSDATVLWDGACDVRTASAPMSAWEDNGGALMRSEHARAADACSMQLLNRLTDAGF